MSGLPVKPSPNLPNDTAILLYPTLGLFEGTIVSLGRGTDFPFQYIGNPYADKSIFTLAFTPVSTPITKKPKYQDTLCYGVNTGSWFTVLLNRKQIDVTMLNLFYHNSIGKQDLFFDKNFNYHAGNEELMQQTILSISPEEIRKSWKTDLAAFKTIRKKYLIYQDL